MWRATWKSLLAKKLRLVLTALSIVLGVGFVAGTFVLTDTMNAAFDELFAQTATTSDLVVRSENAFENSLGGSGAAEREPLDAELLETVRAVPGVEVAVGDVSGLGSVVDPATGDVIGGMGPPTLVISWNELADGVLKVREGGPPTASGQVAIDAATSEKYDLAVGQDLSVIATAGAEKFEIVGIMSFGESDNLAGATLTIFETSTAQRILDKEGRYDAITIKAAEGTDLVQLRRDVQAEMPGGVETITSQDVADESADQLQEALGFFGTALLVFAAIALFVGSFIIVNTFSIIVAQRTRELALLRTLGATRRQVLASVIGEAAVVGLVASAVGVGAGIVIAVGIQGLLKLFGIDLPSTGIQLQPRTIVVSLVVGLVVTLVASIVPARHAAKVAPIQALREPDTMTSGHGLTRSAVIGSVVWAAGSAALAYGLFGQPKNGVWYVGAGAALTLVGVAMLSPLAARPVAGKIGAPFRRLSVSASIGRGNAMRNPRRTASTAAALMIGLGLVSMVAIFAASLKASIDATLIATLRSDLTLSGTSFLPISPDVALTVADVPEVEAAAGFRQNAFRVDGSSSFLTGFDPATVDAVASLGEVDGSIEDLSGDTIAVHRELAADKGWVVGDVVPASFPSGGERPLRIVAIYEENSLLGDYGISLATYDELYVDRQDTFVLVTGADGVAPDDLKTAVEASLEAFPNVQVQDQAEFRESFSGQIDVLLGIVTALLLFAIVIAVFGIINTLGLSVHERTRELGLLRAVGMSRTQVKRMVRYESVIIALFGALLGILVGLGFGWALQQALEPEGITELEIPVIQLAYYVVFAALAGVLAAIWPARQAAKLNVLESIAYE
jgi:putative ABC transport system permease protein